MPTLSQLTDRNAVLAAIDEYDKLGQDEFLRRHRFGPAREYLIHHEGKTYDSKAIAAVAVRNQSGEILTVSSFSGGERTVAKKLRSLGFTVERDLSSTGSKAASDHTVKQIDADLIQRALATSDFADRALSYVLDPQFQREEVEYKRRLGASIRLAQDALAIGDPMWSRSLREAVSGPDDNITGWRLHEPFLAWCESDSDVAGHALRLLWDETRELRVRIEGFGMMLSGAGITQAGAQLTLASVLLMGVDPSEYPPVKTRVLERTLANLRLLAATRQMPAAERYELFGRILDELIAYSSTTPRPLKNRLEAQGAVWCASGGWKDPPQDLDRDVGADDPDARAQADIDAAAEELNLLDPTEKSATIQARRGQGRYRRGLLKLWINCAVTNCSPEGLLRASHLRPWKASSNVDRLNPYNGLLLTPNIDAALDRLLIAFREDGAILLSKSLRADDLKALGLKSDMRLRIVRPEHQPFLTYHRDMFLRRESALATGKVPAGDELDDDD